MLFFIVLSIFKHYLFTKCNWPLRWPSSFCRDQAFCFHYFIFGSKMFSTNSQGNIYSRWHVKIVPWSASERKMLARTQKNNNISLPSYRNDEEYTEEAVLGVDTKCIHSQTMCILRSREQSCDARIFICTHIWLGWTCARWVCENERDTSDWLCLAHWVKRM